MNSGAKSKGRARGAEGVHRNIVTIGASAGGLQALTNFLPKLPRNLAASVFIVPHMGATGTGYTAKILADRCQIRVEAATNGKPFELGCVYVAVPDRHLIIDETRMFLTAGPRENLARPAINPLFRSAAVTHGPCVVGIILTGMLDDGVSGLLAIKECGGLAVVQDPDEALHAEMPRSALQYVKVDHKVHIAQIPALLAKVVGPCRTQKFKVPSELLREVRFSKGGTHAMTERTGQVVPFTCPECGGVLWRLDEDLPRFRCHTGHSYSPQTLMAGASEATEQALWKSLRFMEEHTRLLRQLAEMEDAQGHQGSQFHQKLQLAVEQTEKVREILLSFANQTVPRVEQE